MKKMLSILAIMFAFGFTNAAMAEVGYVDYSAISNNYALAQKYTAELDRKLDSIRTYAQQQDTKIKAAKSKDEAEKIKKEALKQVELKQKEYNTLRNKYELDLTSKVMGAAEKVRASKKLDIIIKRDGRVAGGVDCTTDVLNILKTTK